MFFAAAEEALPLPKDLLQCHDFDYLRGIALLALASLQDSRIGAMQMYIGHYFTLLAVNQWHDEANWPSGMHPSEREERRRLVCVLKHLTPLYSYVLTHVISIGRSTHSMSTRPLSGMAASIFKKAMRKSSIQLAGIATKLKAATR